jgi:hypothetical protein
MRVGDDYSLTLTGAPPNYYIASAKIGDLDVTESLHLDAAPTQPLMIVISPSVATIDEYCPSWGCTGHACLTLRVTMPIHG